MLLLLLCAALFANGEQVFIDVDKDVGILRDDPNTNGGYNKELRVADGARALIKFDIDGYDDDEIVSAFLDIYVADYSGSVEINAFPLEAKIDEGDGENDPNIILGSEGEDGSTWNCPHGDGDLDISDLVEDCDDDEDQVPGGNYDSATADAVDYAGETRISFDVTEDVKDGIENWVIKWDDDRDCNRCNDFVTFKSKEYDGNNARAPRVELEIVESESTVSTPSESTVPYQQSDAYDMDDVFDDRFVRRYDLYIDESDLRFLYSDPVAEEYVPCDMKINWGRGDIEWTDLGCRFKGSGSSLMGCLVGESLPLRSPQTSKCRSLSWKVDSNEFIDAPQTIFGLKKLQFHGMSNGPSLITERLAYEAMNEVGLPISRAVHAELYINDEKIGLYLLVEQIDSSFTKDRFAYDDVQGDGELYKEAYWNALEEGWYESYRKEGDGKYNNMWVDFAFDARDFVRTNPSESEARNFLKEHFNYDSFIDYAPFPILFSNFDHFWFVLCPNECRDPMTDNEGVTYNSLTGDNRYRHNFYHYMEELNGEVKFYLVGWDYDISFSSLGQGVGGGSGGGARTPPGGTPPGTPPDTPPQTPPETEASDGRRGSGGRGGGSGGRGSGGRGSGNKKMAPRSVRSGVRPFQSNSSVELLQNCNVPNWWELNRDCEFCTWKTRIYETGSTCDPVGELMALGFRQDFKNKMMDYLDRFDGDWFETRMHQIRDDIRGYVQSDPLTHDISAWENEIDDAIDYYDFAREAARDHMDDI